ncbi:hypothetical protein [Xanthomonas axonopodis]|uniref:hypothetical protein n=1 Tax=Xanthomonas axonopodis TaxID=53413 RepID=UPI000B1E7337|nr:hypothetical protein [Xanthomonas axonopodis]
MKTADGSWAQQTVTGSRRSDGNALAWACRRDAENASSKQALPQITFNTGGHQADIQTMALLRVLDAVVMPVVSL